MLTPMQQRVVTEAGSSPHVIVLGVTEYEASVITGALIEYGERWGEGEANASSALRGRIRANLPAAWLD